MANPAYHRHVLFGRLDRYRAALLGRDLLPHEAQGRLPWPQERIIRRVERAVNARAGEVIVVRMARQTGKNETEAQIEDRLLNAWAGIPGSTWIRLAPTAVPQLFNSKNRLQKFTDADPFIRRRVKRSGHVVRCGNAQVQFLSAAKSASIVGATASLGVSLDEGHKIDAGKYEEDIAPFTASTNAPTVMWGVGACKLDLLYEYRELALDSDRLLEFPASVWCDLSPAYAAHYAARVAKLGADHPVLLTQYDLVDVEALGAYLNDRQRASLFSGEHPRLEQPRPGMSYGIVVDIGGESERDMTDEEVRLEEPERDSLVAWVLEWDRTAPSQPYPEVRVVAGAWWTGRPHMSVLPDLRYLARHWHVISGAVDARGVGEAVAMALSKEIPAIVAYKASTETVSEDCYDLLARLNTGRVRFWKADPAADEVLREVQAQARHTRYEIAGHERMRLSKPSGAGNAAKHIDGIKALTYIKRVERLQVVEEGIEAYYRKRREERERRKREGR